MAWPSLTAPRSAQCFRRYTLRSSPVARKLSLIGPNLPGLAPPNITAAFFYTRADSPYKTLEDIRKAAEPPRCSTTAVGTASHYVPKLIEEAIKLRLNLVTGYPGGAEQDIAFERGEVQCRALAIATFLAGSPILLVSRKVSFVCCCRLRGNGIRSYLTSQPFLNLWIKKKLPRRLEAWSM